MSAEQARAEPTNPEPAPSRITDADLPRLFQLTDRFAMEAQRRSLRSVRNHILCLIGASLTQLLISLHDELAQWLDFALREPPDLDWMNVLRVGLVAFVALGLATRLHLRLRQPDQPWVKARALAEQTKRLAWYYMMGLSPEGLPEPDADRARRQFLAALEPIRQHWTVLAPPGAERLPEAPEVAPAMLALRGSPPGVRLAAYRAHRLGDQFRWLQGKAARNARGAERFAILQTATEILALAAALAFAVHYAAFEKWNSLMWLLLTLAASVLAWTGHRRYRETAAAYAQTAENLVPLLQEADDRRDAANDSAGFADWIVRCEDVLGRETELWRTRRGG